MNPLEIGLCVLLVHGAIGAFDTVYNHEWDAQLPQHAWARHELALHSARTLLYIIVFIGLAWFEWRGIFAWLLVVVLVVEYVITLVDSVVEDRTRRLSATERVVHMILGLTTGAYAALVVLHAFSAWWPQATAMVPTSHGVLSFALSFYAVGVLISGLRDAIAAHRLGVTVVATEAI